MDIRKERNPEKWFEYEPGERYKLKWFAANSFDKLNDKDFLSDNLLDWEGVLNDGKPVECNLENKELFASTPAGKQRLVWMVEKAVAWDCWVDIDKIKKK